MTIAPYTQQIATVEQAIGHVFGDRSILVRALTHSSAAHSSPRGRDRRVRGEGLRAQPQSLQATHNETLEFLGDRVLGLSVAEWLMERYPAASEGELARRFNRLVCGEMCARVATDIQLDEAVLVSNRETAVTGRGRESILADAMEAVLAAVFLDAGFETARGVVRKLWTPYLDHTPEVARDPKTALQEWAQAERKPLPYYVEVERSGPDHAPSFTTEVQIKDHVPSRGQGRSKRLAEQSAAEAFLRREGIWASQHD